MGRLSYLLDSNILSEPSRPHPHENVQSRLLAHRHEVCTAALVLHEMRYGLARMPEGRRKQALISYLEQILQQPLTILPYDCEAALWHTEERARLASQGCTPPFIGGQIAAIAIVNNLTLVTRNAHDFADLPVSQWKTGSSDVIEVRKIKRCAVKRIEGMYHTLGYTGTP